MKRNKLIAAILIAVMLSGSLTGSFASAAVPGAGHIAQTRDKGEVSKEGKVSWPKGPSKKKIHSESAILMELSTGLILYQKNIHAKHYPASITKILTAMLTAENCAGNEVVTFSEKAAYGIERGSSTIFTEPGEKLTIEQCLYAIMLQSANEVCLGVGEHIAGSIDKFVAMMNKRVKDLGLKDTHFNNPNGLPDPKHYTSAYDMAVIAREAMKNPTYRKVTATRRYIMPKTNKNKQVRIWDNHHQMINGYDLPKYEYKYCIGGKTGYTNISRYTLVTYAEKDGMELLCVIMKADNSPKNREPNEYTDTTALLNFGFENYRKYSVDEEKSEINNELFNNFDSYFDVDASPIRLSNESSVILPKGVDLSAAKQTVTYEDNIELDMGDNVIGHVTYSYGGKTVGSTDILYTKTENHADSHLDAASRAVVGSEIKQLRDSEQKDRKKADIWRKVKGTVAGFFGNRAVQIALLVIVGAAVIFLLVRLLRRVEIPKPRLKRRRRSGGSRRGSRARRRQARRRRSGGGQFTSQRRRTRRNVSRHYEQKAPKAKKSRKSKGVRFHKNHKKTRESFGKNFFDF